MLVPQKVSTKGLFCALISIAKVLRHSTSRRRVTISLPRDNECRRLAADIVGVGEKVLPTTRQDSLRLDFFSSFPLSSSTEAVHLPLLTLRFLFITLSTFFHRASSPSQPIRRNTNFFLAPTRLL
jgi:hypothetical protein